MDDVLRKANTKMNDKRKSADIFVPYTKVGQQIFCFCWNGISDQWRRHSATSQLSHWVLIKILN